MNQRIRDLLRLPDIRTLQTGAAAFLAVLAINPDQVDTGQYHVTPDVAPKVSPPISARSLAATGVTYEPAAPAPQEAETMQEQKMPPGMPNIIEKFIENNTVQLGLGQLSCSGSLIRNSAGDAIGALTAAHCLISSATQTSNPLVRGGDKQIYMVASGPVTLGRGENTGDLQPVGDIQSFVAPALTSNVDQAFAVLAGHTPREVLATYRRRAVVPTEAKQFIPDARTIWVSGYPLLQEGDGGGNLLRQAFATTYVGRDVTFGFGGVGSLLSATLETGDNNTLCSWGISGGEGLIIQKKNPNDGPARQVVRSVGNISSFAPFHPVGEKSDDTVTPIINATEAKANRLEARQTFPGADLRGVEAICNYAFMPMRKHITIYPVADESLIPGPVRVLG